MMIQNLLKQWLVKFSPKLESTIHYYYLNKEFINWKYPQDLNAKLQWLKINTYNDNPLITMCIDKYQIRQWLRNKKLEWLCPQLLGVYEDVDEIDWSGLPKQYAVKCNHGSGMNIIVNDTAKLNIHEAKQTLNTWMKTDYWKQGEIQYKNIKKRIIIEEYLGDGDALMNFKFFCFNGEPKVLYVSSDEDRYIDYYDISFKHLDYYLVGHEQHHQPIVKPDKFESLVSIARELSKDFNFVRVDLYYVNDKIYISELTFIPTGGHMKIYPKEVLREWGSWLQI